MRKHEERGVDHSKPDVASPAPGVAQEDVASAAFSAENVFHADSDSAASVPPPADTRSAQLLLEDVFARGETPPRDEIVLGDHPSDEPCCIVQDELAVIVYERPELAQSGTVDAST